MSKPKIKIGGTYRISGSPYSFDGSICIVRSRIDIDVYQVQVPSCYNPEYLWGCVADNLIPVPTVEYL